MIIFSFKKKKKKKKIKRFSNKIVFKFSKNVELKIVKTENRMNRLNERQKITAMDLKKQNVSFGIKCSFSKINSTLFCSAHIYSTFLNLSSHQ